MDQAELTQRIEKHKFANIISQNTARQIMESGMSFWQQYFHGMCTRVNLSLRWSTCPLVFGCWLLDHVIYLKVRKN